MVLEKCDVGFGFVLLREELLCGRDVHGGCLNLQNRTDQGDNEVVSKSASITSVKAVMYVGNLTAATVQPEPISNGRIMMGQPV